MRILDEDRAVLDHVAARAERIVGRAVDWANLNSGSRNRGGLEAVLDALEAEARRVLPEAAIVRIATTPAVVVGDDAVAREEAYSDALSLSIRPQAPIQVVLTGHYDTVFPIDSAFQTVAVRADGALNGPGIADMKGGISVILAALEAFETHAAKGGVGWTVLLSPDEEIGSPGSASLLAELGARGHLGLTYEPALADGSMAGARKGSGNFHLIVRGRSAHAGRAFHEGANAVAGAAAVAVALHALNGQHEGVTVNVAKISGGAALNVVADHAVVRFNVRVPDAEAADWIAKQVDAIAAQPPFEGLSLELHGGFTRPPKPMDAAQSALFEAVRQAGELLGQSIRWAPSGGVCEGNNLHAAGLPNIDTLGVRGGDIHSDQEFAWPDSFVERAQLSALILCKVASGEIDAPGLKALLLESR
ncbi:hydrolase [Brevundimonas sp. S30B]|uniref:hydrolase n=1 Tax=unclassified Brevundimonas TaxID=2622653 RepID=UPI00107245CC|nr:MULTISPECIES: hydrolase [unclassified Brevundimonas]QBX37590.1 hydrolase [Brevundimonas sp. MF30-B]TFW03617.1 hydrolase [Brevundimonas sp. S30B]